VNVQLELVSPELQEYLFIFENATIIASDLAGLSMLVDAVVSPFEPFEVLVISSGREVGHGWYGLGEARQLFAFRLARGEAQGLLTRLNELRTAYYSAQAGSRGRLGGREMTVCIKEKVEQGMERPDAITRPCARPVHFGQGEGSSHE